MPLFGCRRLFGALNTQEDVLDSLYTHLPWALLGYVGCPSLWSLSEFAIISQ